MIDSTVLAENIRAAVDDNHIEHGLPLYFDGGRTKTDVAVMELKPMVSKPGFSVVLSNGDVYEVEVQQVR